MPGPDQLVHIVTNCTFDVHIIHVSFIYIPTCSVCILNICRKVITF